MSRINENKGFVCEHCNKNVFPLSNGSYRNHCPFCLYSKHLDDKMPGDRQSKCKGMMEPVQLKYHSKKGYQIVHSCKNCDIVQVNKIADKTVQSDDIIRFMNELSISM
ncbi:MULTISPECIES: RNHCP domain-containing protein [Bacillus]|uniref:RNHCP domain-containing protein n=1 Tax=Bacillus TaxID=1386 RepID=UPI0014826B8E|nr:MULTISPECIES: RNHCP domain-containing protein [Bacillus]